MPVPDVVAAGEDLLACLGRVAAERSFELDPAQRACAASLARLHQGLLQPRRFSSLPLLRHLAQPQAVRGVYLWGGVGRGKSFLMDAFFACIPLQHKRRVHFHRFMQEIHARLGAMKGQPEPLAHIAAEITRHTRLLCLDEFHITDIADAMLMRGLLQGLFGQGVTLVATSNAHPGDLYRNGLQHGQFLPAIAWIKERMDVVHLDGGVDYRLRALEHAGVYHTPCDAAAEAALAEVFGALAGGAPCEAARLTVEGREIAARCIADGVAWFDFATLCGGPRGQADYIELARRFPTVLLSGVPQFGKLRADEARRFLWLVDEFYDRRVKLMLCAAVPLGELDREGLFEGEFERVLSRLAEMQSRGYLGEEWRG